MNAIMTTGNNALTPTSMESAIQLAEMMARGKLVPSHLHNSPGDCLMVIEASMRWQMSPFAVAQCTSVIQGKLMFEGKLVAAALNASGILSSRLDYEFSGAGQQRAVIVRGTLRGETKPREVTVFLADAKTSNSLWTKQPDQQLVYAGTRVWARRHAPEVMLGVYAPEEFDRAEPFAGQTIDADKPSEARQAINDATPLQPLRSVAAATPRPERKVDPTPYEADPAQNRFYRQKPVDETEPRETDEERWKRNLLAKLASAQSRADVVAVGALKSVHAAQAAGIPELAVWVTKALNDAFARFPADETEAVDDDLDEVAIAGEHNLAAG